MGQEVFAPQSFFTSVLGGVLQRKAEVEAQNLRQAELAAAREQKIFSTLLGSDDPEIQSMALAGLLDTANPKQRKKGLRGWMGEMQESPFLSEIQTALRQPVPYTVDEPQQSLPARQSAAGVGLPAVQPTIAEPPGDQAAAMPATALTEQKGQAPPTPMSYTQAPPTPYTVSRSFLGPRKIFLTSAEKVRQDTIAREMAEIEGTRAGLGAAGFAPDATQEILRGMLVRKHGGGLAGQTYAEGEITPDASSPTGFSQTLYLRSDPTKTFKMPAMPKTALSSRAVNSTESVAHELFGRPNEDPRTVLQRLTPAEMGQVSSTIQQREITLKGDIAKEQATEKALAEAAAPLSRMEALQATQSLRDDWFKVAAPQEALKRQMGTLTAAEQALRRGDVGAGSEAIIVTFEKMLDSLSVVRESEYLRPAFNQSLYDRVAGYISTLRQGGARMTPEVLQTYVRLSREIGAEAQRDFNKHRTAIERTARTAGIDPANIFGTLGAPPAPTGGTATAAPAMAPSGPPVPGAGGLAIGDTVLHQGKRYRIVGITNGQADLEPIP